MTDMARQKRGSKTVALTQEIIKQFNSKQQKIRMKL